MINNALNRKFVSYSICALLALASIFVFIRPASAIDETDYSQSYDYCQDIKSKLSSKAENYQQKRQQHLEKYKKISEIYQSIAVTLEQGGYSTEILFELKPGLDRRIAQFEEKSQVFVSEMTDSSDSACRDRASFNQELTEARESLKQVQLSVTDIQKYVQDVLITSIDGVVKLGVQQ